MRTASGAASCHPAALIPGSCLHSCQQGGQLPRRPSQVWTAEGPHLRSAPPPRTVSASGGHGGHSCERWYRAELIQNEQGTDGLPRKGTPNMRCEGRTDPRVWPPVPPHSPLCPVTRAWQSKGPDGFSLLPWQIVPRFWLQTTQVNFLPGQKLLWRPLGTVSSWPFPPSRAMGLPGAWPSVLDASAAALQPPSRHSLALLLPLRRLLLSLPPFRSPDWQP